MYIQLFGIIKYANNTNEIKLAFFILPRESLVDSNFVLPFNLVFDANLCIKLL